MQVWPGPSLISRCMCSKIFHWIDGDILWLDFAYDLEKRAAIKLILTPNMTLLGVHELIERGNHSCLDTFLKLMVTSVFYILGSKLEKQIVLDHVDIVGWFLCTTPRPLETFTFMCVCVKVLGALMAVSTQYVHVVWVGMTRSVVLTEVAGWIFIALLWQKPRFCCMFKLSF